jgi:hypothetical protein
MAIGLEQQHARSCKIDENISQKINVKFEVVEVPNATGITGKKDNTDAPAMTDLTKEDASECGQRLRVNIIKG